MGFPTTSLLDDFTRADEDPLSDSGNWEGLIYTTSYGKRMAVVTDQATSDGSDAAGYATAYWHESFTGAQEAWATVTGADGQPIVGCCIENPDELHPTGYFLWGFSWGFQLVRQNTGSATSLAVYTDVGLNAGDSFGLSAVDGTLRVHYKPAGGSWTNQGETADATYADGYIGLGFYSNDAPAAFTAFGGGASSDHAPVTFDGTTYPLTNQRGLYLTATDLTGAPIGTPGRPAVVKTPEQPQVTIPLSDSRTGQVQVSMYEKIAGHLDIATACLKVLYVNPKGTSILVLNGIILSKSDDFDASQTTAQIHDPTIRLKKRYLGYGHICIELAYGETISDGSVDAYTGGAFNGINSDYGIPLDGRGLRLMMYDAAHGTADRGVADVPGLGIRVGTDNATPQPAYGDDGVPPPGVVGFTATATEGSDTLTDIDFTDATWTGEGSPTISDILEYMRLDGSVIPDYCVVVSASGTSIVMSLPATGNSTAGTFTAEDAIYCQLERGDCVYDDVTDIVQAQGSFECDWVPVDAGHTGFSGASWEAGQMAELYTADRVGTDRSQGNPAGNVPVVFIHGEGGFHLTHAPDADSLITYEVQVGPGGPADPLDIFNKVEYEANTVGTYGIWEDWEQATSAGTGDTPISNALLTNRAAAILTAYQDPPQFVTATIDLDSVARYAYGDDFFLGDTVTVYAKKGYVTVGPLAVRITSIGITRADEDGNCQLDLTLVPYLTANPGVSPDDL